MFRTSHLQPHMDAEEQRQKAAAKVKSEGK